MPSIRLRQAGGGQWTATISDEGLDAVQTAEKRQWEYLVRAYVDRHYVGKGLPGAVRNSLRRIAAQARYDPGKRGPTGLPKWERGTVLVPKTNWRGVIGGVLVMVASDGKPGVASYRCYVPLLVDGQPDEGRPLYLLVAPA